MGRHTDPESLRFIKYLEDEGNDRRYFTELECPIANNMYQIDVVWKTKEKGDPIITFEVETTNRDSIFKNSSKIFDTPQSLVPKPLRHFMIVLKKRLTEGQKTGLFKVLNLNNTYLFEDLLNDEIEQQKFFEKLKQFSNRPDDRVNFLPFFQKNFSIAMYSLESDFAKFGPELPYLLKDDFVPFNKKHIYEKAPKIIEFLNRRMSEIKSVVDLTSDDLEYLLTLTKLVERIDGKETSCLSQGICPKCGAKIVETQTEHGGFNEDGPYAIEYRVGCESCDYILNHEIIDI